MHSKGQRLQETGERTDTDMYPVMLQKAGARLLNEHSHVLVTLTGHWHGDREDLRFALMRIAFYFGLLFIWSPLWFLVCEVRAKSEQNALVFPQFSAVNNMAVIVVEVAGIILILSAVSRSHWLISSVSIFSSLCSLPIIAGLLLYVVVR